MIELVQLIRIAVLPELVEGAGQAMVVAQVVVDADGRLVLHLLAGLSQE